MMSEGLRLIQNDDGVFSEYDDTFDITIHCQSKEEQNKMFAKLKAAFVTSQSCDDCVSRRAVIDVLTKTGGIRGDALKVLYDLQPVASQPKLILCKDRMPDYYQLVLTFDGEYFCVEQRIPYIIGENGEHIESEWWVDADYDPNSECYSGLRDGTAVAWMPLPTMSNEEDAEQ